MATIGSHYFRGCLRGARLRGVDIAALLRSVNVPPSVLTRTGRGTVEEMARLVRAIWDTLDDEFMGCTEHRMKRGVFEMMARLVLPSPSIDEMLKLGIRFYNLITDDIVLELEYSGERVTFTVTMTRPELDPEHYWLEFWLVIWHRFLGWACGHPVPLNWASFGYAAPKTNLDELRYMFPCRHEFNAERTCLSMPAESLRMPVIRSSQELNEMLATSPLTFMTMPGQDRSYARRVRSFLISQYADAMQFPPFTVVARRLQMTEQTLRRRLRDESWSYRTIKENIRMESAMRCLARGNAPIADIAISVGYSEPRAFTRAFRQWTGWSPGRYRQELQHEMAS
jgi:AraC-like DNA-binding protein